MIVVILFVIVFDFDWIAMFVGSFFYDSLVMMDDQNELTRVPILATMSKPRVPVPNII